MTKRLEEGDKAPPFKMSTDGGDVVSLKDYKGQSLVMFFYPRDDTPGCTKENIGFTEKLTAFRRAGAEVIGVSKDTVEKHGKFRTKHSLKVILASDAETDVIERYGSWVEKNMYGKKKMGIERSTFLIDGKGVIRKVWRKVKVADHVEEVLDAAKALKKSG